MINYISWLYLNHVGGKKRETTIANEKKKKRARARTHTYIYKQSMRTKINK
jgi:hypothetical protein